MNKFKFVFLIFILFLPIIVSCSGGSMDNNLSIFKKLNGIPASEWEKLSRLNFFFGHQSVGNDIIAGIEDLMKENPSIKLNIKKINDSEDYNSPIFGHFGIGKNFDPSSKILDFENKIHVLSDSNLDVAFFKLCFVDFNPSMDTEALFDEYKNTIEILKSQYSNIKFIHFTAPLTCPPPGIKGWVKHAKDIVKKIIGKTNQYDHSSANDFNKLLLEEYSAEDNVFDLAKYESTTVLGDINSFTKNDKTYYQLVKDYTYDGGHLNTLGRKYIAAHFLLFLTELELPE